MAEALLVTPYSQFDIKSLEVEDDRPRAKVGECPLEPFSDSLVVEPDRPITKVGEIYVPGKQQRRPTTGTVIVVGEEVTRVKPGDRVIYTQLSGVLFLFAKKPWFLMMKEDEVMGKLKTGDEMEAPDTA